MPLAYCSVVDVTFDIVATRDDSQVLYTTPPSDAYYYGGNWVTSGAYCYAFGLLVVRQPREAYVGGPILPPGLYKSMAASYYNWPGGSTNLPSFTPTGAVIKTFTNNVLQATLRFKTEMDPDVPGKVWLKMYCDGVLALQWSKTSVLTENIYSALHINLPYEPQPLIPQPHESTHVGKLKATIWQCDIYGKVLLGLDGLPSTIRTAQHKWPDWVTWVRTTSPSNWATYVASADLFCTGMQCAWRQLAYDANNRFYSTTLNPVPPPVTDTTLDQQFFQFYRWYIGILTTGDVSQFEDTSDNKTHVYYIFDDEITLRKYDCFLETYEETTPALVPSPTGTLSSICAMRQAGKPVRLFWIEKDDLNETTVYQAYSNNAEVNFTVVDTGITGYQFVEVIELPLDGRALALLHSDVENAEWYQSVGTYDLDTNTYINWTTPTSIGLAGKDTRGSLELQHHGLIVFSYVDDTSEVQVAQCRNVEYDGTGVWV